MGRLAGAIEVLDELEDAALVMEFVVVAGSLVAEDDLHAAVEEGQLLQAAVERVVDELGVGKDLRVGLEGGLGADLVGGADAADVAGRHAALVFLLIDVAVAADFDLAPFGEEVDDRDADAVQAAGGLVGPFAELAAELEDGHHAFERGNTQVGDGASTGMPRPSSSTVTEPSLLIVTEIVVGVAGHGLVDRVVDDFVDQVVQAAAGVIADVHARPFADVLQIGEVLQVGGGVFFGGGGGGVFVFLWGGGPIVFFFFFFFCIVSFVGGGRAGGGVCCFFGGGRGGGGGRFSFLFGSRFLGA